jgi:acetylglutamate kinase
MPMMANTMKIKPSTKNTMRLTGEEVMAYVAMTSSTVDNLSEDASVMPRW